MQNTRLLTPHVLLLAPCLAMGDPRAESPVAETAQEPAVRVLVVYYSLPGNT